MPDSAFSYERELHSRPLLVLLALAIVLAGCGGSNSGGETSGNNGGSNRGYAIQIQRVQPSRVMVGVPQGAVTLTGTNFTSGSTGFFDGVAVPTFFNGPNNLELQIPNSTWNTPQMHRVQVSDPTNGNSNIANYEVYAPQPGPQPFAGQFTQYMSDNPLTLVPDINGDGRADLIVSVFDPNTAQYTLEVRFGQADGSFAGPVPLGSFALQASANFVLAGDFNHDGYTDLILMGGEPSSQNLFQVLMNDGTGHFTLASTGVLPSAATVAVSAATGDFDGDGKLDFVYGAAANGEALSLFLGNGDGTFSNPVPLGPTGGQVFSPSAADLNADGRTDLVYVFAPFSGGNQIRELISSSGGGFTDLPISNLPSPTQGFAVADFNNDHIPDIFAVDANGLGRAYLGAGNGTFPSAGTPIFACDGFLAAPPLVAGDFDSDGNVDVVTRLTTSGPDEMLLLFGDGKGNFTGQRTTSEHSFVLQVGDVNGDGIPDIFSLTDQGFGYPYVVLGRKDRNFPSAQILLPNQWGLLSAGDVFQDGFTDLLVGGSDEGSSVPGNIYHSQPNGTFAQQGQAPSFSTVLVDLNGDGMPDMVGFSGTNLFIWQGDGSGFFGAAISAIPLPDGFQQFYFRDMDGDGHIDIVLPGVILYGKGNFQFDPVPITFLQNFVVGDFDGDGIPDIATASGVMFGQGNRSFTAPLGTTPLPNPAPIFPTQVAVDINHDGMDDLVIGASPEIEIYISAGRQGFIQDQALLVNGYGVTLSSLAVADFNGDGLPDIAAGLVGYNDVVLFFDDGTGKYQVTSYDIGINAVASITADFNHDGKPDLAFRGFLFSFEPPTVTVLLHK